MSIIRAKDYLKKYGLEDNVIEFDVSTATVEMAAKAIKTYTSPVRRNSRL